MRDFIRGAVIGAVLAAAVIGGLAQLRAGELAIKLKAQEHETARWQDSSDVRGQRVLVLKRDLAEADAKVAAIDERSNAGVDRVKAKLASFTVEALPRPKITQQFSKAPTFAIEQDTTAMTNVQRPIDKQAWLIPTFFVEAWKDAVSTAFMLDTARALERQRFVRATVVIAALDNRRRADSSLVMSLHFENALLRKRGAGWCHAKCGAAIAVVSIGVGAWAIDKVHRMRPPAGSGLSAFP